MTPEEFKEKWGAVDQNESSSAQTHFNDLCAMLGVQTPHEADPKGRTFRFEKKVSAALGGKGYADVWKAGHFAWEYKGDYKNLNAAYLQLKNYVDDLGNPPLLVVSDMKTIIVRTSWTNTLSKEYRIGLDTISSVEARRVLRNLIENPDALKPNITPKDVTEAAARDLGELAGRLRRQGRDPLKVAHFINRLVFCMFAQSVDLLRERIFSDVLEEAAKSPDEFSTMLGELFHVMSVGNRRFGKVPVEWFNGGLFDDDEVIPLNSLDIRKLEEIAGLSWKNIEPTIYGTLFEAALNEDDTKRKAMASLFDPKRDTALLPKGVRKGDKGVGIHYTDSDTIMKIVEPVVLAPLREEWAEVKADLTRLLAEAAKTKGAAKTKARNAADKRYYDFRQHLRRLRVLDPACGSGNFLYMALQKLKDFEHATQTEAAKFGYAQEPDAITTETVRGIEVNPYAAELARMTIWIGELQWQMANAGPPTRRPILGKLNQIENRDALLAEGDEPLEAHWPPAEFIVGNPPFVGGNDMKREVGEGYLEKLRLTYSDRIPGGSNLVCYWFLKAWEAMKEGQLEAAGFVSTQAIRKGSNRKVLDIIATEGMVFNAWSNEPWVLDGAKIRVSMICFSERSQKTISLDGNEVSEIYADISAGESDVTKAVKLSENLKVCFQGPVKVGPFDIDENIARAWLLLPANPNGRHNQDVLRPWVNGYDVTRRPSRKWIIDFGEMSEPDAALYEAPFQYVTKHVKPEREKNSRPRRKEKWWQHGETVPGLRRAMRGLGRVLVTPRVAKHRLFAWCHASILPDTRFYAFGRDNDIFFGILSSRFHELWALRNASNHGEGNDPTYNNLTCFETFPFPEGLTPNIPAKDYETEPRAQRIAAAAKRLNELREAWLNPPDLVKREPEVVPGFPDRILPKGQAAEAILKKRTLTSLYNEKPQWLVNAHRELDEAVAAAYGWPADLSEEDILSRLLTLNHERAAKQKAK